MRISGILVKWRLPLMALMTVLAVVCATFIPRLNVIYDIPYFLPNDSPMKIGLAKVAEEFPSVNSSMNAINVMFTGEPDKDTLTAELASVIGGLRPTSIRTNGTHTLFQFIPPPDTDSRVLQAKIEEHFGESVIVELDIDKNMPANIIPMILLGSVLVFIILFIMCSSVVEVLLFLVTTGIAVAINMGSNILLDGISFMTNTMVAVLQMILSMDYSIFLMNRYRQEKQHQPTNNAAMAKAISGAAPSILSSALTTIVSLLMLVFMHLRIGADLGLVLAKGVLCSLICNFTVLPGLILQFDKAITATTKKIPMLPANTLSRFEMRFRLPLAILFVGIFVASFLLQQRTEVSFSALWDTPITREFSPENSYLLMYDNADEDAVPGLLDTLERDPKVKSCLSYPGLMVRGYTAAEMAERFGSLSPIVTEDLLKTVYYAYAHPRRTERLSIAEIEDIGKELSARGLMPEGFDMDDIVKSLTPPAKPAPKPKVEKAPAVKEPEPVQPALEDTLVAAQDTVVAVVPADTVATAVTVPAKPEPKNENTINGIAITYELATRQMTAKQMAKLIGMDRSLISTAYRMAGRSRKPATMSPYELSSFIMDHVVTDKRYSSYINLQQLAELKEVHQMLDSAFLAGPSVVADVPVPVETVKDSTVVAPADTIATAMVDTPVQQEPQPQVVEPEEEEEEEDLPPTPLERLAEMAFSGKRYTSARMYSALSAAGIPVTREDMDLLYIYAGSRRNPDPDVRMTVNGLLEFLESLLSNNGSIANMVPPEASKTLAEAHQELIEGVAMLHSEKHSIAAVVTDYDFEAPETFAFVDRFKTMADRSLPGEHYLIGESVMYKEFKDGFPDELLLLTILTVAAIFIIVLLTFKSIIVPILLIITVLSGVYVDVYVSGIGGNTMYFLAYLIVQSILMGATIDYSILFTSYYRNSRMQNGVARSLAYAYQGACHSIITSGLILTVAPYAMGLMISDAMVASILKSLAGGALVAVLIILFILPGMIAAADSLVAPKGAAPKKRTGRRKTEA